MGNVEKTRLLPRMEMFADDAASNCTGNSIARKATMRAPRAMCTIIKRRARGRSLSAQLRSFF